MTLIDCPVCRTANPYGMARCIRCSMPLKRPENAATAHALAFVERERQAPFFGAYPDALDFSPGSLARLDSLFAEMWGSEGEAPGDPNWQPSPGKRVIIVNFGAYLGEVLCQTLPARWEMHPSDPNAVIAARVINAQQLRINTFAQIGARFRDGAGAGMQALLASLTGNNPPKAGAAASRSAPVAAPVATPASAAPAAPRTPTAPALPSDPVVLMREAQAMSGAGQFDGAVARLRRLLALQPANVDALLQLAKSLAASGDVPGALVPLDDLKRLRPGDSSVADTRAVILAHGGRFDEAIGTLEMALMRFPGDAALTRRRAFVRLKAGPPARAQKELEQILAAHPGDAEAWIGLAHSLEQQGKLDAAQQALQTLLKLPASQCPAALEQAARERLALLRSGAKSATPTAPAPPPAAQPASPASANPSAVDAAASAYQAGVAHASQGRFADALPFFLRAAEHSPQRASYLRDVGNCLNDLGRPAEARDWLLRSLAIEPTNAQVLWLLGVIDEKLGDRAAAIARYRMILAASTSEQRWVDRAFDRLERLNALPD